MSDLLAILRRVASGELSPESAAELIRPADPVREPDEIINDGFSEPGPRKPANDIQSAAEAHLEEMQRQAVVEAMRAPHKAEEVRGDVALHLLRRDPLPAVYAEWLLLQLYTREPHLPNRPAHRTRTRDEYLRMDSFIHWWRKHRPSFRNDKAAVLRASAYFKTSPRTVEKWLSGEYVFRSLRLRRKPSDMP